MPFGAIFLFVGIVSLIGAQRDLRRRRRLLETKTSPVAGVLTAGVVEIKGRIEPGEEGTVLAPFSGSPAVWFRIWVEEERGTGKHRKWVTVLNECESRTFYVRDSSGQNAKVIPSGARVIPSRNSSWRKATPEIDAFMNERELRKGRTLRFVEELLEPGDELYALGPARREPGPAGHDGYRATATTRVALYADTSEGEGGELLLSNLAEPELASRLRATLIQGIVCTAVGVCLAVAGVAMWMS